MLQRRIDIIRLLKIGTELATLDCIALRHYGCLRIGKKPAMQDCSVAKHHSYLRQRNSFLQPRGRNVFLLYNKLPRSYHVYSKFSTKMTSKNTNIKEEASTAAERKVGKSPTGTAIDHTHPGSRTSAQLEVNTRKGKLLITAKLQDSKLDGIVVEKVPFTDEDQSKNSTPSNPGTSTTKEEVRNSRRSSSERNFITPIRAMSDFLLRASDLEDLPEVKRRSNSEQDEPVTMYLRKDVEAKAIEIWGSRENLLRECWKREIERKKHQYSPRSRPTNFKNFTSFKTINFFDDIEEGRRKHIFTVKRRLRNYRGDNESQPTTTGAPVAEDESGLKGKSGQVILVAVAVNATNLLIKTFAWISTGSHSMFAEVVHSFADTSNQLILAFGIHKSAQAADLTHPYGYSNMRYVSSLIAGVGIFCIGAGLSLYHGFIGLLYPGDPDHYFWGFIVLMISFITESYTLRVAVDKIRHSAKEENMTFREYVFRSQDPCVNVVLTEDSVAVLSVVMCISCMSLTSLTGSYVPDAIGSLLIGCLLASVASFIITSNGAALVGQSIPRDLLNKISAQVESDVMVKAIYDVKGIDMGNSLIRYRAELGFDGRELTKRYLEKQDLNHILKEVKAFETLEDLQKFMLAHGERIVELMGGEIGRIEMNLMEKFPGIRYCDFKII